MKKKTLVLGASPNNMRYSHMAVVSLLQNGHEVVAVGSRKGRIDGIEILTEIPIMEDVHTISLYLNPSNQEQYINAMLALKPQRIIFNPGTENPVLMAMAEAKGIQCEEACTLVMLRTNQY